MLTGRLQQETVAVILGGGRGTRLYPLTRERSKPAVPLGGKFRFIDIALSNAIHSGMRKVFVLTQYNSASLNNHVARTYKFDAFTPGFVAILAAEQSMDSARGWFQGTADAVRHSLRYLRDNSFRNVLIMPGDHLCRINLRHLLELHERQDADVSLVSSPVGREDVERFRILKLAPDGRITSIARRPTDPEVLRPLALTFAERDPLGLPMNMARDEEYLAFIGIYLIKKQVLIDALERSTDQDLLSDTLPRLFDQYRCYSYAFSGYWRDIGTIRSFYDASIELTAEDPPFRFQDPDAPIYTHARYLPSARIYRSTLDGALVADGAVIHGASIERSVIGVRARIGEGARIEHSVIFGADAYEGENRRAAAIKGDGLPALGIGPGCFIRRAIIDKNARIGAGCRLENVDNIVNGETENCVIRDGVIIIPKDQVLLPGTII